MDYFVNIEICYPVFLLSSINTLCLKQVQVPLAMSWSEISKYVIRQNRKQD